MSAVEREVEVRHLRAFVAVAEELHFSRAAVKLHLAQQALSHQIAQLEVALGARLFDRNTRRVELTEAGAALLPHAVHILAAVATARERTAQAAEGTAGQLFVAYTTTVSAEALPTIVAAVHDELPEVRLQACEMWQADIVAALDAHRFDVGFARCPVVGPELHCVSIREEPLGVLVSSDHRLVKQGVIDIGDLAGDPLTIWPRELSPAFYDRVVEGLRANGFHGQIREFENLGPNVLFSDSAAQEQVALGRAFSLAFAHQYEPLPSGFVWRPLHPELVVPLHMVWAKLAGPRTKAFVELVLAVAQRERWLSPNGRIGPSFDPGDPMAMGRA